MISDMGRQGEGKKSIQQLAMMHTHGSQGSGKDKLSAGADTKSHNTISPCGKVLHDPGSDWP